MQIHLSRLLWIIENCLIIICNCYFVFFGADWLRTELVLVEQVETVITLHKLEFD